MQLACDRIEDRFVASTVSGLYRLFLSAPYETALLAAESFLAACALAAAGAMQVAFTPNWQPDYVKTGALGLLILVAVLVLLRTGRRASDADLSLGAVAAIGVRCTLAVFAIGTIVRALTDAPPVPRTFYLFAALTVPAAIIAVRAVAPRMRRLARDWAGPYDRRVLIVTDRSCLQAVDLVHHIAASARIASVLDLPVEPALRPAFLQRLAQEIDPANQDEIWLAVSWTAWADIADAMEHLAAVPLPVRLLPDPAALRILGHRREERGGVPTFELRPAAMPTIGRAAKRFLDIAGALAGLILLAPLLLFVAAAIRFDSPGPVFFRQARGGRYGQPFRIWKFRTMRVVEDGQDIPQATRGDARVTTVGRWLRSSSIDELPQLLNVLHGEMSLIGPRPHALAHDAQYAALIQEYPRRYHVKPGLTGWAQINGSRGETVQVSDMIKRVSLDVWYANHWSFWLDIKILIQTVASTRAHKSAY